MQSATKRKVLKYAGLSSSHLFVPIAIKTFSPMYEAGHFLSEWGRRLSEISDVHSLSVSTYLCTDTKV